MADMTALLADLGLEKPLTIYNNALPAINPVDIFRCAITEKLAQITKLDPSLVYPALEWTNTLEKGDLILAVPRLRVKEGSPAEQAARWAAAFPPHPLLRSPIAIGTFLRFEFNAKALSRIVLPLILRLGVKYGSADMKDIVTSSPAPAKRKKVIVEFSSPNIAKQFHAGHLRSTIIGGFIANLFEAAGWETVRLNYLGDWGRQYGILAIGWERYGNEEAFQADPIAHLFRVYVRISADFKPEEDAYKEASKSGQDTAILESQGLLGQAKTYFKRMEDGDEDALALWSKFRGISIEKYKKTYERLNIHFTDYSGESTVQKKTMETAERILLEKGIAERDNGAVFVDFKKHGAKKLDIALIRNRNGTSNYLLRDIGAAMQRLQTYDMDKMIYVVMSEQEAHMQRLFKILELMGDEYAALSKKMQHITFGKVMGMSTRRGTVVFLDDLLDDVGEAMHDVMRRNEDKYRQVNDPDQVADMLAISAVMVQDMSGKRINNYPFNIERMTSFEGDTGPYLQYAHARLCSIQRKAGHTHEQLLNADFRLLTETHATDLVRLLAQYPDVVNQTLKTLEPTTILTYLFRLTHQLSSSYDVLRVVGAPEGPDTTTARAALYEAARLTIKAGMTLLGLSPVERM